MVKYIAAILLVAHLILGLFVWLEDHDNARLRVIRLGIVVTFAIILMFVIYLADGWGL